MVNEGPTTTGSINAKIGADTAEFERKVSEVKAKVAEVRGESADVKVTASVDQAIAKLTAVEAAQQKLSNAVSRSAIAEQRLAEAEKSGTSSLSRLLSLRQSVTQATQAQQAALVGLTEALTAEKAAETAAGEAVSDTNVAADAQPQKWIAIAAAVAGVVSLLGPLAAVSAAGVGGFVGLGAAGVLAVKGIQKQMQDGTAVGKQYSAGLDALQRDLGSLEDTAAVAFLASFQQIEQDITNDLPQLNQEVGQFTGILGDAASTAIPAIIDGLNTMNPLFVAGAEFVDGIAHSFAEWEADGGMKKFVTYAEAELPKVERAVDSLAQGIVSLSDALTPVGNDILQVSTAGGQLATIYDKLTHLGDDFHVSLTTGNKDLDGFLSGLIGGLTGASLLQSGLDALSTAVNWVSGLFGGAASSTDKHTTATKKNTTAAQQQATEFGVSTSALKAAKDAQAGNEKQTEAATLAMQLQNDAAGLMQQAFDKLNGKVLNAAEAQTSLADANNGVVQSFKDNGKAIDGSSAKAVANQQAIQQSIQAAQANANAIAAQTGPTVAGTQAYSDSKDALEAQLKAQGDLTPAVQTYIDQLYSLSNFKVISTKIDLDSAVAQKALQDYVNLIEKLGVDINAVKAAGITIGTSGTVTFSDAKNSATTATRATGGVTAPGELTLVGEKGPEWARFPTSTEIFPNGVSPLFSQPGSTTSSTSSSTQIIREKSLIVTQADPTAAFADYDRRQNLRVA